MAPKLLINYKFTGQACFLKTGACSEIGGVQKGFGEHDAKKRLIARLNTMGFRLVWSMMSPAASYHSGDDKRIRMKLLGTVSESSPVVPIAAARARKFAKEPEFHKMAGMIPFHCTYKVEELARHDSTKKV